MMAEDGGHLSGIPDARGSEGRSSLPRTFIRLNDLSGSGVGTGGGELGEAVVEPAAPAADRISTTGDEVSASGDEDLPFPAMAPVVFFYLKQSTRPRSWCLNMVANPWFERASMLVILLNCVTLGMFHPCEDMVCDSERCKILMKFDDFIFAFFAIEMVIKMVALGIFGKKCYLGDTWNRLDFFIVVAGMLEYSLNLQSVSFSAVRTVRVLRPLRAINRVPSMRILVTLLLDTLPMLGNVLLLCFFVFFIFGIVGVQLWAGLLRNRCFLGNFSIPPSVELEKYFHTENDDENPFICSKPPENGMRDCGSVPKVYEEGLQCTLGSDSYNSTDNTTCVNWNQYYTNCSTGQFNPFKGAINFDNICYAWIAIFQVITLEGWVDIMYFVMDAHSFYNFIYFILLIIIGSFFMINLCLVVIATQFSETKQRESQLMKEQRVRFLSNASTLASFSEPGSCYDELIKYLVHVVSKGGRQVAHVCRFLARRAGLNVAASPPATEPQRSQRRRRKSSRQGSVSVHHMAHHHHHHHHHHHYHLGNGSVRGVGSSRCLEGRDVEAGAHNNNGGALVATAGAGLLALAPPPSITTATSDTNLAILSNPNSSSARSLFYAETLRCTPSPTNLGPNPGPFSLAPAPSSRAMKRNSVPFAAPGPKNYPTLQARALAESRRGSCAASTLTNISFNLNIPPTALERRPSSLVDTHTPTAQLSCQLSARDLSTSSSAMDAAALTLDPESCPYCAKALANESEGGNETPGDSDSEGIYEFTQDLHHRDRRDSRQPKKKSCSLGKTAAKVVHFWRLVCDTFRKIVDSKYFGRGIMIAILINTLSMGIEYHEQPEELTNALEISNIVFTSLFALEMLLKILVYGPFGYIKNPYNIFDGIIVVISVWEIVGQQDGGLSVLRTFRLMRVLKLVRFMPALQRQLVVLMKTMDNVATFCMLLMLFIFIFSILGMHLFGCKFGSEKKSGDTLPDRKNFDSLLWAIVTVFQILTQEDWNKVLYNGMASTTPVAALYFIALMTFGNYVLFNLLVAILVEGFQTEEVAKRDDLHVQLSLNQLPIDSGGDASKSGSEIDSCARSMEDVNGSKKDLSASAVVPVNGHVDLKTSLTPPLITHTAATPMPVPKLPPVGDPILGYEARRGSNVSIDPACYDKSPTSAPSSSPLAPWSSGSGWTSRRSSWNSLGRAPSLKRQKRQSGERRSLLSGEGGSSSDDEEGGGEGEGEGEGGGGGLMDEDGASLVRTDSMSQSQRGPRHRRMESVETRSSMDLPPDALLQVPFLYRSASMHSSRPPSLGHLRPPEHSDCNGKGSPSALGPTHVSLEDNTEDENTEEESTLGRFSRLFRWLEKKQPEWCRQRDTWSLYLFPPESRFRIVCNRIISHKMFDHIVLVIIFLNCITIAMERPHITTIERIFLKLSNYIFTAIFVAEMAIKIVALGWCLGDKSYLRSSWNILDGMLVMISVIDILVSLFSNSGTKILGMLRVLRLLRTLRPLRVISRAPGLKLVVETLMSSLKPIGNIVVICCAFFIIFGILGVQLFKGKFFVCEGEEVMNITNKSDCLLHSNNKWVRHKYNFDNLGQALMSLFVLASKDGWVDIMYDGLDAVGVDQQPQMNHNPWMLLYFISFLLIVAFFVLNMFVGVVVENFHKCRRHQEAEEAKRREEKRLKRMEKKRRSKEKELAEAQSKPYYSDYSPTRLLIHKLCTSHYLDLFITIIIGLNVITMSMEHDQQSKELEKALKICNYVFTIIFVLESIFKLVAFGFRRFFKDKWNQLDLAIVLLSIMGITLEEIDGNSLPINPTIIRIMRVLRIARVLKLLKMAVGMRALLDTVMQALPQVGNLGLLFMLLFFIFAALGVELFGDLICDELHPCEGLGRYATFKNFGMAFLLLFRVSTGDNWNGIMKDTLRDCAQNSTCYNTVVSPLYFVSFVLTAQFVLVNVVIAVLMKHLEESNKEAKEEAELEAELALERQLEGGDMATRSPQLQPLALGTDRSSSGGSPWRSTGGGDVEQERDGPMDSPTADITRDSVNIREDPPSCLEPLELLEPPLEFVQRRAQFDSVSLVIQGSMEGELSLMDNLSASICHFYALPPKPRKHSSDKKPEQLDPGEPLEDNLLSVRKPAVGRTHSLPNDSYMFFPLQPCGNAAPAPAHLLAQSQGPQHILGTHRAQSGSSSSVRSQPEERSQQLAVPADLFRPISPHSHSDSESIPRLPPPRRTHALSRTLRRQVAVSTDSQEALCSDGGESNEGLVNVASLGLPPSPSISPSPLPHHLHQQPALCLVPATPGTSPKPSRPSSVHTQLHDQHCLASYSPSSSSSPPLLLPARPHQQEEASADREVSLITHAGLAGGDDVVADDGGGNEGYGSFADCRSLRQLKRFHSADTQGRSAPPPRPRPYSWLDDPRGHSIEACSSSGGSSPQRSTASTSSGFVSRADSLQIHSQTPTQTSLPSPRRKKKMSPPCISVDPPDGLEPQPGLYPSLGGLGVGGLGMPPPLPGRDTCLRRRAPSSDSKDSFDLGVGEGSGQDGGSPNPNTNPKLLTLPREDKL
ncbi:voltage-dependent T-type calcium channel subunit alpha-1G isoform X4 [Sebastes umbrosus]|uniref:voltage-dependent T-type calcium channel subunit alpha-1G isoform X4 n=1 Tax=Sebastes umbrosus TaxID=72105 RepID=UPI00189E0D20|nr:voltage-dependent T-type calcium channel subunit alpha-1G isoform X4 [Sebastes umbrosus]